MIPGAASMFRLYVNGSDRWQGKPLYQAVVETARAMHLAGASVFLVDVSYGAHHRLRDARSEYGFLDIPVVIEFVDAREQVEPLLERLRPMVKDGFATLERVQVVHYEPHEHPPGAELTPLRDTTTAAQASGEDRTASGETMTMAIEGDAQRVTVYVGSADTWQGRNLAMAIVERCRRMGIAGATASLGVMGFGKHSRIHRAHWLGLSSDLPERIEIVDLPDRIATLLPVLEAMVSGGLIIVEDVRAICYQHHGGGPTP